MKPELLRGGRPGGVCHRHGNIRHSGPLAKSLPAVGEGERGGWQRQRGTAIAGEIRPAEWLAGWLRAWLEDGVALRRIR